LETKNPEPDVPVSGAGWGDEEIFLAAFFGIDKSEKFLI